MSEPADKPVESAPAAVPVADPAPAAVDAGAAPAAETGQAKAAPVAEPTLLETAAAAAQTTDKPADGAAAEAEKPAGDKPADKPAEEAKPAGDNPQETDKTEGEKPAEAAGDKPAEAAVKPEPVDYKYELPETLKMDDAIKGDVHSAFDAFRADPANAQPLIDLHARMLTEGIKAEQDRQWDFFNDTRKTWRQAVMADEVIGGSGHQTAMTAIAQMRDTFASDHKPGTAEHAADLQAFDGMLRATGVGDHPVFLRMMHRVSQVYGEPGIGPTDIKPAPVKQGGKVLYDNPRSKANGPAN